MYRLIIILIAILLQACMSTGLTTVSKDPKVKNGKLIEMKSYDNDSPDISTIYGQLIDFNSKDSLGFAIIKISNSIYYDTVTANILGNFILKKVPEGIYNLQVPYVGYEPFIMKKLQVLKGKKIHLIIGLDRVSNFDGVIE